MLSRFANSVTRRHKFLNSSKWAVRFMSTEEGGSSNDTFVQNFKDYNIENVMFPPKEWIESPSEKYGINGQYASALFRCSLTIGGNEELNKVYSEVKQFLDMLESNEEYETIHENIGTLENPVYRSEGISLNDYIALSDIPRDDKVEFFTKLGTDKGFSETTIGFMSTLADSGRLKHVPEIYRDLSEIVTEHSGLINATVTSAEELNADQKQRLEEVLLKNSGEEGSKLNVTYSVDEDIIGGLIIELGDSYCDMSLATEISVAKDEVAKSIQDNHTAKVNELELKALKAAGLESKEKHDEDNFKLDHLSKHNQTDESIAQYITAFEGFKNSFEQVKKAGGWASKVPISFNVDYTTPVAETEQPVSAIEK